MAYTFENTAEPFYCDFTNGGWTREEICTGSESLLDHTMDSVRAAAGCGPEGTTIDYSESTVTVDPHLSENQRIVINHYKQLYGR